MFVSATSRFAPTRTCVRSALTAATTASFCASALAGEAGPAIRWDLGPARRTVAFPRRAAFRSAVRHARPGYAGGPPQARLRVARLHRRDAARRHPDQLVGLPRIRPQVRSARAPHHRGHEPVHVRGGAQGRAAVLRRAAAGRCQVRGHRIDRGGPELRDRLRRGPAAGTGARAGDRHHRRQHDRYRRHWRSHGCRAERQLPASAGGDAGGGHRQRGGRLRDRLSVLADRHHPDGALSAAPVGNRRACGSACRGGKLRRRLGRSACGGERSGSRHAQARGGRARVSGRERRAGGRSRALARRPGRRAGPAGAARGKARSISRPIR